jgi:putative peptidoglycan lipid II flippase
MKSKNVLKSTIHVTLLSFAGIVLGFLSQLLIAFFFGTGNQRDAYFGAIIIPTYLTAIFLGSIGAIFLSQYIHIATNLSKEKSTKFFNNVAICCLILLSAISLFTVLCAKQIISITVPGFTTYQYKVAVQMLQILAPTLIFQSLTNLFGSVIQSNHKFVIPALPALITPVVTLTFVLLFQEQLGISSLAWGNLLGNGLSFFVIFLTLLRSKDILFPLTLDYKDEYLRKIFKTAMPLLIAGIIYRFSGVWERLLASKLSTGSISYLGYSNQLLIVFSTLTSGGISTIFFPILSRAWSDGDMEYLQQQFVKAVIVLLYLTLPITFLFCYFRVEFIQILFERGAFDHHSTVAVAGTLALLMGAFIFQSLGSIVTRSFYFMEKTVWASAIGIIEIILYLITSIFLVRYYSFYGLAFAFSFAAMSNVILSAIIADKKIGFLNKNLLNAMSKIVFSCIVALFAISVFRIPINNLILMTTTSSLVFAFIYVLLTYFLKLEVIMEFKATTFNFFKGTNGKN